MLTRAGRTLVRGAAAFVAGGVVFGNWPMVGAGAILLLVASFGAPTRMPTVEREVTPAEVERGGRFVVTMRVTVPAGMGVAEIHQRLPDEFSLRDGNNLRVVTLGWRSRVEEFRMEVVGTKRGEWELPPARVRVHHPTGLATTEAAAQGDPVTVRVRPRPLAARIPRGLRGLARRPIPDGDVARMGVATNEFREIRQYVYGDPPRHINWKATARRMASGAGEMPLVNETEWEGRKSVWIIVDAHARLSVGTNVEDAREHAADAALSLVQLYLRRGCQVGMSFANAGDVPTLRGGTGEPQARRAREALSALRAGGGPDLVEVLRRDAQLLHRGHPVVILVTRLSGEAESKDAIRALAAMGQVHGRRLTPALILDLEPPEAQEVGAPMRLAREALRQDRLATRALARAANVIVTPWRLGEESLERVLVAGRFSS